MRATSTRVLLGLGAATGRIKIGSKSVQEITGLKGRAARGAIGAGVGIPVESGQEWAQTGIEQWGARQDLSTPEAQRERIEGAAMGMAGGAIAGGGIGLISGARKPPPEPPPEQPPAQLAAPAEQPPYVPMYQPPKPTVSDILAPEKTLDESIMAAQAMAGVSDEAPTAHPVVQAGLTQQAAQPVEQAITPQFRQDTSIVPPQPPQPPQEPDNAIQVGIATPQVSPVGRGGADLAPDGQGVEQGIEGQEVAGTRKTEEAQVTPAQQEPTTPTSAKSIKISGGKIYATGISNDEVQQVINGINDLAAGKIKKKGRPQSVVEMERKASAINVAFNAPDENGRIGITFKKGDKPIKANAFHLGQLRASLLGEKQEVAKPARKPAGTGTLFGAIKAAGGLAMSEGNTETMGAKKGLSPLFNTRTDNTIRRLVEEGSLNSWLPHEMRITHDPNRPPQDSDQAVDWVREHLRNNTTHTVYSIEEDDIETRKKREDFGNLTEEAEKLGINWRKHRNYDSLLEAIDAITIEAVANEGELSDEEIAAINTATADRDVNTDFNFGEEMTAEETEAWLGGIGNVEGNQGNVNETPAGEQGEGNQRGTEGGAEPFALESQTEEELRRQDAEREAEGRAEEAEIRNNANRLAAAREAATANRNANTVASDNYRLGQPKEEVERMVKTGVVDMFSQPQQPVNEVPEDKFYETEHKRRTPDDQDNTYHYTNGSMGMTSSGAFTADKSRWITFSRTEAERLGDKKPAYATKHGLFVGVESGERLRVVEQAKPETPLSEIKVTAWAINLKSGSGTPVFENPPIAKRGELRVTANEAVSELDQDISLLERMRACLNG